jgi:hypothetical protein
VGTCDWLGVPRGVGAADLAGWTESTSPSGPVTQRRGTGLSWPSTSHLTAQACTGAVGRRGSSTGRRRHCCRRPELVGDHRYGDSGHPRPSRGHLRVAQGLANSMGCKYEGREHAETASCGGAIAGWSPSSPELAKTTLPSTVCQTKSTRRTSTSRRPYLARERSWRGTGGGG